MSAAVAKDAKRGDFRTIASWALFDFAGAPFSVLIVTFVYANYFTKAIASDPIHGTALWSRGVTVTALVVALCSPLLGALADRGGYRKRILGAATVVCAAGSAVLYWALPGQVLFALACVVVANIAFEFAAVFNNAFLPDIAPRDKVGTLSRCSRSFGPRRRGSVSRPSRARTFARRTCSSRFGF
jgi:UMF1 family MFS transporter